jgi:hypothetical protein
MVVDEDDRLVIDIEAILGPARAEEFLNHPDTSHADHTHGVGPAPKK